MTAKYTIKYLYKIAVNKENQELRDSFIESFPLENPSKAASIADQWYLAYRDTQEYDSWRGLPTLNDVIQATKEVRPIQRESEDPSKNIAIALAEKYPEANPDIFELNPKFLSWANSRWGDNSIAEEIHPIRDSIATLIRYQGKISDIRQKANDNPEFVLLLKESFGERNLGDIKSFSVDDMEKIMSLSERKKPTSNLADPNYEPEEFVGQFGEWKLWMPLTREDSIYIAQFNRDTLTPDTTWCTARTSGSNLFYSYATSEVLLFYAIKDGASCQDDEAFQSIGYKHGEVVRHRGVTVNRANSGKSEEDHKKIFGSQFDAIYSAIKNKAEAIGGEHPVKEKFRAAAIDKKVYEDMIRGVEPDGVEGIDKYIFKERFELAKSSSTPPEILGVLAEVGQLRVRQVVARNPATTSEILSMLAKDESPKVREIVAENSNTTSEILSMLAEDTEQLVRMYAAGNQNISEEDLAMLANDKSLSVRRAVSRNPRTPGGVLVMLAKSENPELMGYIATNENTPPEALQIVAVAAIKNRPDRWWGEVMDFVASNDNTSGETLRMLSEEFEPSDFIYHNPNTPADVFLKELELASADHTPGERHPDRGIRHALREIAQSLVAPAEVLRMLTDYNWPYGPRKELAENENAPVDILRMLAEDDKDYVRSAVASNPSTPTDILSTLARSEVKSIRAGVAGNPNASFEDLHTLSRDEDNLISVAAWENIKENWKEKEPFEKNSSLHLKIKKLSSWLYKAELREESEKILKLIK